MRRPVPTLVICSLFLAGCDSWANPMNWFGNDEPRATAPVSGEASNPLIPDSDSIFDNTREELPYQGTTIDAISDLTIERVPGGVIIRATGRSATQGPFNARLSPVTPDETPVDGVLTYQLQAQYTQVIGGAPQTREVTVARQLTNQELGDTRTIRVEALQNALQRRR